jgi:hypothetical protein
VHPIATNSFYFVNLIATLLKEGIAKARAPHTLLAGLHVSRPSRAKDLGKVGNGILYLCGDESRADKPYPWQAVAYFSAAAGIAVMGDDDASQA